jgi:hypothetical protein
MVTPVSKNIDRANIDRNNYKGNSVYPVPVSTTSGLIK